MSVEDGEPLPTGSKIVIHYVKSPSFRTVHVDGAIGGSSPGGTQLTLSLYNERHSLPDATVHSVGEGGAVNNQNPTQQLNTRPGILREIDFNAVMSLEVAQALHEWLGRNIAKLKEQRPGVLGISPEGVIE